MSIANYKKVQYPWALSLDKLDIAYNELINSGKDAEVDLTEEKVKARYIELNGLLPAEASETKSEVEVPKE